MRINRAAQKIQVGERMNPTSTSRVLNLAEAARFVRCSRSHLSNVINGKVRDVPHLPSVRIGRRVLFRRESLEQWLRQIEGDGKEKITRPPEIKQ
jgi:excisionase family DNA binding protein